MLEIATLIQIQMNQFFNDYLVPFVIFKTAALIHIQLNQLFDDIQFLL